MSSVLEVKNLYKSFKVGIQEVDVLNGISLNIPRGDLMIIFGPSGCGKSTFLHSIIGLEVPTKGTIRLFGTDLYKQSVDERSEIRKKYIGMIYQQPNWIKALDVLENVAFPLFLMGVNDKDAKEHALKILKRVGMDKWADFKPFELSSGQQQKVALCRALITDPEIIIADEPTGNLDYESGKELMLLLIELNKSLNKTILMVTHDLEYLRYSKHFMRMLNGKFDDRLIKESKEKLIFEEEKRRVI